MGHDDISDLDAHALSKAIHTRRISCRELMQASLARIARLNPRLNALVNLADEGRLLAQADACDAELARGTSRGFLHGMPLAIKDTAHALGFPSTMGSPLLTKALPEQDSVHVARMKAAGCIVIGKSNVPEFGLGSHSYNTVFGATGNAWDLGRTAGGSSGGAAVALAHRLVPLADGSDFMGSLRNPAAWNHVFGLRPSAGRVPAWPKADVWTHQPATDGPMARRVRDLAALLSIQAGRDDRAALSLERTGVDYTAGLERATLRGVRIGWLRDLDGHLPFEPGILEGCEAALRRFEAAGAVVEPAALGFSAEATWQAWLVWRRALVAQTVAAAMAKHTGDARARVKLEALWELDRAQGLTFAEFMRASQVRTDFLQAMLALFEHHDVLALPVTQCWPFAITDTWPRELAGRRMDTYHRWMEVTLYASFAGLPAISVPAGFGGPGGGLPLGLQLIGKPLGDAALLQLAAAYEADNAALLERRPPPPQ